jgi:hypothetical protein
MQSPILRVKPCLLLLKNDEKKVLGVGKRDPPRRGGQSFGVK